MKSDGLGTLFVVEGNKHFVIVQEYRIDKHVDQHLTMFFLCHIQLAEAVKPETHKFFADLRFFQLFKRNAIFKFLLGCFQF